MAQSLDGFRRKVSVEAEVVEAAQRAVQTAVVDDGLCPVEADVGVSAQLVERQAVDVYAPAGGCVGGEVWQGGRREIADLAQLLCRVEAAETFAVAYYGAGEAAADARHALQQGGVGGVEAYVLPRFQL